MSIDSYRVGNRVYRGGSSAPTMGTVDPMGYIDRESDKRSGLAAAAMRRMAGGSINRGDARVPAVRKPGAPNTNTTSINRGDARLPQVAKPATAMQPSPTGSTVSISPTGKLVKGPRWIKPAPVPQTAADGATSLPYDAQAGSEQIDLQALRDRFERDNLQGIQGLERDYLMSRRGVEMQKPDLDRGLLNSFAGRGMAFSSGYGNSVGNLNNDFANTLGQLESGRSQGLAQLLQGRQDFDQDYASRLRAIQEAAVRRLAQQRAGTLGLGMGQ